MLATFWLLGIVLGTSQVPTRPAPAAPANARADWVLTPRLARGQELVYRGSFSEEAGSRVQQQRSYRFETRHFVLDVQPKSATLVTLTSLHDRQAAKGVRESTAQAARVERIRLDLTGKVSAEPGVSLVVPAEGAPSIEVGAFLELPRTRPAVGQGWDVAETGRPVMAWKIAGTETAANQSCVKIVGVQQSDDWQRPRADRAAWRRVDTVWVSPRTGIATKVERVIEQREPARTEVARKSVLRYELDSELVYPARLADDRRQEIAQAFSLRDAAAPMLTEPGKYPKQLAALQKRIATHLDVHPPTPYREAVLAVKRSVEAAARGEVVKAVRHETARPVITAAAIGETAPDFVATEVTGGGSGRLGKWKGKAVLLCFYSPASYTAPDMLKFAQEVNATLGKYVQVVGLSVSDDAVAIVKQQTALKLTFPLLFGSGLRASYGVESTPRIVLIDAAGVVRGAYAGWGGETRDEVMAEVRRWMPGK